ncbi:unnamed protein product [Linum trigynum]|uniref:Uncharacterized protein n=1 Tax=Linum trigynum TaxID=586398 RepID=A0AAV2CWD3_9ROSI
MDFPSSSVSRVHLVDEIGTECVQFPRRRRRRMRLLRRPRASLVSANPSPRSPPPGFSSYGRRWRVVGCWWL